MAGKIFKAEKFHKIPVYGSRTLCLKSKHFLSEYQFIPTNTQIYSSITDNFADTYILASLKTCTLFNLNMESCKDEFTSERMSLVFFHKLQYSAGTSITEYQTYSQAVDFDKF